MHSGDNSQLFVEHRLDEVEFNSIFTREILERRNVILPIWHGVSQKDVYDYSPSLAERWRFNGHWPGRGGDAVDCGAA